MRRACTLLPRVLQLCQQPTTSGVLKQAEGLSCRRALALSGAGDSAVAGSATPSQQFSTLGPSSLVSCSTSSSPSCQSSQQMLGQQQALDALTMRRQHAQLPRHWHNQPLYSFLSQAAATQQSRSFTTSRAAHGDGVESQIEDLGTRADALEERLSILEGQEGIRTAIHSLALMLDTANQRAKEVITMDTLGELFTPTAVIDADKFGGAESLEAVVELLQKVAGSLQYSKHHVANLVVSVNKEDPSSGKARWYFITAATIQGTAYWSMETVAARMRKGFDNKWRINTLKWEPGNVLTPFHGPGWAVAPNALDHQQASAQPSPATPAPGGGGEGAPSA